MQSKGRIYRSLLIIFFTLTTVIGRSSSQNDSLLTIIEGSNSDSAKIEAIISYIQEIKTDYADSALIMLGEAELIATSSQLYLQKADVLYEKGLVLFDISEFSEALDQHFKAKQILDSVADVADDTTIQHDYLIQLMNIARVFQFTGRYAEAHEYFFEALDFLKQADPERQIKSLSPFYFKIYFNIGAVYINQAEYDQAEIYYTTTLNEIDKDDKEGYASILNNLGIIAKERRDYQQAFDYHYRALEIRQEIEDFARMAQSYNNIGTLHALDSNYSEAKQAYRKALQLSQDQHSPFSEIISLFGLSMVSYETKDYKKAYDYFVNYKNLNDSILNQNKIKEIAQLEVKERYRKKLLESKIQHDRLELESRKQRTLFLLIISVSILGVAIFILLYFLQKSKTKREQLLAEGNSLKRKSLELEKNNLERELEYRNKELATNVMWLASSNEFITIVTEQLLKRKLHRNKESQEEIGRIIK